MQNPLVKRFPLNTHGRDFIVGDIHGCYDLLMSKLEDAMFDRWRDRLFSVGDLVDRGPDSERCAQLIKEEWFHAVRGNHEELLAFYVSSKKANINRINGSDIEDHYIENGGQWAVNLFNGLFGEIKSPEWVEDLSDRLMSLPLAIEVETRKGTVGIIHADVPYNGRQPIEWKTLLDGIESGNLSPNGIETLTWGRKVIKPLIKGDTINFEITVSGIDRLFTGHTITDRPIHVGNRFWIDTGAFKSGNLTLIRL